MHLLERASKLLPKRCSLPAGPSAPLPSPRVPGVENVLAAHEVLLSRVRKAYGHDDQQFEQHLLAPVTQLAAWVHLLPGPPGSGYGQPGGALEQALTTSLFCLQAADGRTFDDSNTASPSHDATQRWRLACALGGLFAGLRQLLGGLEVASDAGESWPAAATPLLCWLRTLPAPRYRYRWVASKGEAAWPAVYVASRCITGATMAVLLRDDTKVASGLLSCIAGVHGAGETPVADVVFRVVQAMAAREQPAPAPGRMGPFDEPHHGLSTSTTDTGGEPAAGDAQPAAAVDLQPTGETPGPEDVESTASCLLVDRRDGLSDRRDAADASGPLTLETSRITNPCVREQVEDVVNRLEGSFDTMLSRIVPGGVFIALQEFVGQRADGAAVVRAVYEAGLLAIDASTSRRVSTARIEGTDVAGIVLRAEAFRGYSEWVARWQDDAREKTYAHDE